MVKEYEFQEQLHNVKPYEEFLAEFCERVLHYKVETVTLAKDKTGIDRIFTLEDGTRKTAEFKVDWVACGTSNLFAEVVSVLEQNTPGWMYTSQADWLEYFLPSKKAIYQFDMQMLKQDLPFISQFKLKPCRNVDEHGNYAYSSLGHCAPLSIMIKRPSFMRFIRYTLPAPDVVERIFREYSTLPQ